MARLRKMEPLSEPFLTGNNNQNNNDNNLDPASLNASSRCRGLVAGFIVQIMNVVGCTYSYYRWGQYENATWDAYEWTLRVIVWLISQVDLALYLIMWMGLTYLLTYTGMEKAQRRWGLPKRVIFVTGVQFYIGVVTGVFVAWASIDLGLGLPVPLLPMVLVLVFGLAISYTMICCYDLEEEEEEDDDYYYVEEEEVPEGGHYAQVV